jgi:hypothetical protein
MGMLVNAAAYSAAQEDSAMSGVLHKNSKPTNRMRACMGEVGTS